MSQYFSRIYRGFLIEQTASGWIVPQLPTWSNGPVNQGPYGTYQIACHVLDRVLDANPDLNENKQEKKKELEKPIEPIEFDGVLGWMSTSFSIFWSLAFNFCIAYVAGKIALLPLNTGNPISFFGIMVLFIFGAISIITFIKLLQMIADVINALKPQSEKE